MGWFGTLFPTWAKRRAESRLEMEFLAKLRTYAAAETGRLVDDWTPSSTSADAEILNDLEGMRNRSRQLIRDDPHASAAVNIRVAHVIGETVRIQPTAEADLEPTPPVLKGLKLLENQATTANQQAEWAWSTISESIDGFGQSFAEFLELEERQVCESGESLIRFINVDRRDTPLSTAVELIEPDRLMTPYDLALKENIRNGIEFGNDGQPKTYWINKHHPGDTTIMIASDEFDAVPAADIIHDYAELRPGQSRGVPWLVPVMRYLRDKGKYVEAELIAQRLSACLALIIHTKNPSAVVQQQGIIQSTGERQETIKAGQMHYLRPNEEVTQVNPIRPGDQFVPSIHEFLRAVGTALDIPYVVLAQDYENVNYSSMRAAIVQMQLYIGVRRERKRTRVIKVIWQRFYDEAVMAGMVVALNYRQRRHDYTRFRIQWPATRWVDPQKEVEADVNAVASGLLPLEFIAAKYGTGAAEIIKQIAIEKGLREQAGIGDVAKPTAPQSGTNGSNKKPTSKDAEGRFGLLGDHLRELSDAAS